MITGTLIISMTWGYGCSMTTVPGFKAKSTCEQASAKVLSSRINDESKIVNAACVEVR